MVAGLSRRRTRLLVGVSVAAVAGLVAVGFYLATRGVAEAPDLRRFVRAKPPVPVVFTSRTDPSSFAAAAPEAEGFRYPGTIPWASAEGRLRRLDPNGRVYELTWGRPLPDGGTLIDVMSPTVSPDGRRVLFAGRRAAPDPGRWRIYEVELNGDNLRQLTGGPDDPGCVSNPPMRFAADGGVLPEDERRRLDYDDIDPADRGDGGLLFASSRLPDLGRGHARRATQIWHRPPGDAAPHPITANRNNDRWPFPTSEGAILFSLWSRNQEAVTADERDIQPVSPGRAFATAATDVWVGARTYTDTAQFGYAVKIPHPVWRPRPTFNNRVVFMTDSPTAGRYRIAQADWGYLRNAPSALPAGERMPRQSGGAFEFGPDRGPDGRPLSAATPSPCPPDGVLFSGAAHDPDRAPLPGSYGLYLVSHAWESGDGGAGELLFDDPGYVDAEPVAAYPRVTRTHFPELAPADTSNMPAFLSLPGRRYSGPLGLVQNNAILLEVNTPFPGQTTDTGKRSVSVPPTGIKQIAFYASHRDRFDDPHLPRVPGRWEKLFTTEVQWGDFKTWVPADPSAPTVLAGLGADGKVFRWSSGVTDSEGRSASFYALAGDHYSGTKAGKYHFCYGCHVGHTYIDIDIGERLK
ncbi:hypothetical protein GobsT_65940 [Gemmata obscuriglobus]|uniref:Hydrazine synthase alpha subunit middle domain-containing protein n=1 Tax=Gemmata obscuriglobus TaxID=114 RepID=A0A2Z3GNC4_9BACT|nr:PD40 domain-containing protein [Gemmata obscuriglobus]AWM35719.1 hypothetical protein C1280_00895 [Gemmata obscuriglobus]QEG31750.1 hypothetical protein GobsT_65940 [Gemmata obscuriglobus]VTS11096.1 hypothetical protein : Uncharacterized protein OS=Roseiflexus castenholzii (strain DSM 13941 / HLO8) GN=Rcas_1000 PE=4 SV=1 [Gemmata obscuriglobus UQM 2246]